MNTPLAIDDYIKGFPPATQQLLQQLRDTIKKAAPEAEEVISYSMPAFRWNGLLVWFAGYKHHIGFYPKAAAMEAFKNDLVDYKTSKGAVQFPLDKPLPLQLIAKIVTYRMEENAMKNKGKKMAVN